MSVSDHSALRRSYDREIESEALNGRERELGSEHPRDERKRRVREPAVDGGSLAGRQRGVIDKVQAGVGERGQQLALQDTVTMAQQRVRPARDRLHAQTLRPGAAVNHHPLVEVAADDAEELDA